MGRYVCHTRYVTEVAFAISRHSAYLLGHPFAIGECGGAMQEAQCPECRMEGHQTRIGGQHHRLVEGNVMAAEMDGATAPAWPQ